MGDECPAAGDVLVQRFQPAKRAEGFGRGSNHRPIFADHHVLDGQKGNETSDAGLDDPAKGLVGK